LGQVSKPILSGSSFFEVFQLHLHTLKSVSHIAQSLLALRIADLAHTSFTASFGA
jgi:hypothetical protein